MPRATCLEDTYEYRVKRIMRELKKQHADEESELSFEGWLEDNYAAVGGAFLDDVDRYMGVSKAISETE